MLLRLAVFHDTGDWGFVAEMVGPDPPLPWHQFVLATQTQEWRIHFLGIPRKNLGLAGLAGGGEYLESYE